MNQKPATETLSTAGEFAEALGRAIIAWQHVEGRSAQLYVALLGARNREGALNSFFAVHSFATRAMMLKTSKPRRISVTPHAR